MSTANLADVVASRVRKHRKRQKLSLRQLAERIGSTKMRVWRQETRRTSILADELPLFAKALNTTVAELVA